MIKSNKTEDIISPHDTSNTSIFKRDSFWGNTELNKDYVLLCLQAALEFKER